MSTREVLQIPSTLQDPKFGVNIIRMMSSFILDLSNMFIGPFGLAAKLDP